MFLDKLNSVVVSLNNTATNYWQTLHKLVQKEETEKTICLHKMVSRLEFLVEDLENLNNKISNFIEEVNSAENNE